MDFNPTLALVMLMNLGVFLPPAATKECKPGRYGSGCRNECHCHSLPCDPKDTSGRCEYGCQPGWQGTSCNKVKREADISYQCLDLDDGDKHLLVVVQTNGVIYRSIDAVNASKSKLRWCWDTHISSHHELTDVVTVKLTLTQRALRDMLTGNCAGTVIGEDTYQWLITVREWEGITLGFEQNIQVTCNFSKPETYVRSANIIPTDGKEINFAKLTTDSVKVHLNLLDAVTRKVLSNASIGSPVLLQMHFEGYIQSVTPYNCYGTSADGKQLQQLVDGNGCQPSSSPVKPFTKSSDSNAVETPWFPYFAFDGSPYTKISCSFNPCYDKSCRIGCKYYRHVRSASQPAVSVKTISP